MKMLLSLLLFTSTLLSLNVRVVSKSAILINADTGVVLFDKHKDRQAFPASITKIATALYALKHLDDLDAMVSCPSECLVRICPKVKVDHNFTHPSHWLEYDGTTYGIRKGEVLPLNSLFYGMMLVSGNDAANVIAHHASGNILTFTEGLNSYLKDLGCHQTQFKNPHGLHHPDHYTTAHDMALIAQEALKDPRFCNIVTTLTHERPKTSKQDKKTITNGNRLIKKSKFYYSKAFGMKTGYHSKAGYTLVTAAKHDGRTLIAVILGSPDPQQRYRDAINLFDSAFAEKKEKRLLFKKEENTYRHSIDKKTIHGQLEKDVFLEYYPSEEQELKSFLHWDELSLPITQGERVGEIVISDTEDRHILSAPLYATDDAIKSGLSKSALALILIAAILAVLLGFHFYPTIRNRLKRR